MLPLVKKTLLVLLVLLYCKGGWGDGEEEVGINEAEAVDLLPVFPLLNEEAPGLILQDTEIGVSEEDSVGQDMPNEEDGDLADDSEDSLFENEETDEEPEPESEAELESEAEPESDPEPELDPESESEPEPESEPESGSELSAESGDDSDQGSLTTPEPEVVEEEPIVEADTEEAEEAFMLPMIPLIELEEEPACLDSEFGCCQNSSWPAHGPSEEGCCLNSTEGCCPDFIRPREEGCDCSESAFGCCLDGVTTKLGEGVDSGCGCKESEHGCCQVDFPINIELPYALIRTNTHLHLALISRVVLVVPQNMDAVRTERQWRRDQMGRVVLDAKPQSTAVALTTSPQPLDQTLRAVVVQAQHMAAAQMG